MKVRMSPELIVANNNAEPTTRAMNNKVRLVFSFWILTCAFLSESILDPLPAGTVRTRGSFSSSIFLYTKISSKCSLGRNSVIDLASMDFPVPGSPTIITCLLCSAALRITIAAASCPITLSTNFVGIGTSAVDSILISLIHSSTGMSHISSLSSETPNAAPSAHESRGSTGFST